MSQGNPHAHALIDGAAKPANDLLELDEVGKDFATAQARLITSLTQRAIELHYATNPPEQKVIYVAAPTNLRAETYTIREGWTSIVPMMIGAVLGLIAGIYMIFQFKAEAFNVVGPDMQYMLSLAVEKPWFKIATLVITTAIGLAFGMLVALLFGPRTQTGIRLWAVDSDGQERLIPQGIAPTTTHVTNVRI